LKADFRHGVDIALKIDLGSTKKTRIPPPASSLIFPHRMERKQKVLAVIGYESELDAIKEAGADMALTIEELEANLDSLKFDDLMVEESRLETVKKKFAKTLRGKTPSKKNNMATADVLTSVRQYKDVIRWKSDKTGIINTKVGQLSFSDAAVLENVQAFIKSVKEFAPDDRKESFIKRIALTTPMGPGLQVHEKAVMAIDAVGDETLHELNNALQFTEKRDPALRPRRRNIPAVLQ